MDENQRFNELLSYKILDTEPEQELDDISKIASLICGTPISLISFIDSDRQWYKSKIGVDKNEVLRKKSICQHVLSTPEEILIVNDITQDERFGYIISENPELRFYAGAPLTTPNGHVLGTLCILDKKPRKITTNQIAALKLLSKKAMDYLNTRKVLVNQKFQIEGNALRLKKLTNKVPVVIFQLRIKSQNKMTFDFFSNGMARIHSNYDPNKLIDNPELIFDHVYPEDIEAVRVSLQESISNLKEWNVEYRIRDKKRVTHYHRIIATPEKQDDERIILYGTIQDISLYKDYEATLEGIAFDISHILRRPVTTMVGLVNLFDDLNEAESDQQETIVRNIKLVSEELEVFTRKLNSTYASKKRKISTRKK